MAQLYPPQSSSRPQYRKHDTDITTIASPEEPQEDDFGMQLYSSLSSSRPQYRKLDTDVTSIASPEEPQEDDFMAKLYSSQSSSRPRYRKRDTDMTAVASPEEPQEDDEDWHQSHHVFFISHIIAAFIMTVWPWIFFAVVMGKGGIEMHGRAAASAYNHPRDTTFVITALASVVTFIIDYLFARGVTSLAQKWVVHKDLDIFHISFFTALKSHEFLWQREDWRELLRPGRLFLAPTVMLFIFTFTFVTSGLTSLLTPVSFTKTSALNGTELDFGSTDPGCISWFASSTFPDTCDWIVSLVL
jgi:hypothetical protein